MSVRGRLGRGRLFRGHAIGQVVGGPIIGLIGTWTTLRTALRVGTLLLLPAIGLYGQLLRKQLGHSE